MWILDWSLHTLLLDSGRLARVEERETRNENCVLRLSVGARWCIRLGLSSLAFDFDFCDVWVARKSRGEVIGCYDTSMLFSWFPDFSSLIR